MRRAISLESSESNYREIFDKANDGIFIHDIETGEMLDANSKLYGMYGYTAEEFRALRVESISADRSPYTQRDALNWMRMAAREQPQLFEWLAKDRNGRLFWVEVNLKRTRISGQDRLLAIVRDISERKHAEDETRRLREALAHVSCLSTLGEMAASLAHEINQPLAAIMTNTQAALRIIQNDGPCTEEVRDILEDIAADDSRAGEIIRRMREPLKRDVATLHPLEINDVVRDIRQFVRNDTLLPGILIDLDLGSKLPPVRGDRIQLQQVLLNLMMNAIEAVRGQPAGHRHIKVLTTLEDQRSVRLEVSDCGPGIPASARDMVFEPFWTTKSGGLGLGLSICRTLVDAHDGRIWAENVPEGGTRFVVVLPGDPEAPPSGRTP